VYKFRSIWLCLNLLYLRFGGVWSLKFSTAAVVHDENKSTSAAQGLYDSKHVPNQEDKPKSLTEVLHEVA